jgi:uncharacterized protein
MILYLEKMYRLIVFLMLLISFPLVGQEIPGKSSTLVTDYTNTLSPEEKQALERRLVAFNDTSSTQIAVVMIQTLDGYPLEDYAFQLAEKWGIGRKGKNNGILILVAVQDRKVRIEVGYGLEAVVPDALAKRIVEKEIKPAFKQGNYYEGLDRAAGTLMGLAAGEFTAEQYGGGEKRFPGFLVFIILAIIFAVIFSKFRSVRRYAHTNHIPFWIAWGLMNAAASRSSGRWSDFSSGSGSFGGWGGSGGGGFGGFGGGSFGGGGASGSW